MFISWGRGSVRSPSRLTKATLFVLLYLTAIIDLADKVSDHPSTCRPAIFIHIPKAGGSSMIQSAHGLLFKPPDGWHFYHMSAAAQRHVYAAEFNKAFTFAVVRNPFALLVSYVFMGSWCRSGMLRAMMQIGDQRFCYEFMAFASATGMHNMTGMEYHLAMRQIFTAYIRHLHEFWMSHDGRIPGLTLTDPPMLPGRTDNLRTKRMSQRAWLTDERDKTIIVQHVIRLEDEVYHRYVSGEIVEELCDDAVNLKPEEIHMRPDMLGEKFLSYTLPHHLENVFFYYTAETCKMVQSMFAVDFTTFGYDASACIAQADNAIVPHLSFSFLNGGSAR